MNVDAPSPPTLRRRARVRATTAAEIKLTARRLLVTEGAKGLTLRAIARSMGMTAPALYRYFPSREDLLEHVVADLYDEVTDALETARDDAAGDDVARPILAASRRFRQWALAHPDEFGLLFGSPIAGGAGGGAVAGADGGARAGAGEPEGAAEQGGGAGRWPGGAGAAGGPARAAGDRDGPAHDASRRFGRLFGELIARLYQRRPFPIDADADISPHLADQLREWGEDFPVPVPLGVLQVFLSCWIRLYGAVCLEVFGHLKFAVADAELMFEAELRSLAELLGAGEFYRPPAG